MWVASLGFDWVFYIEFPDYGHSAKSNMVQLDFTAEVCLGVQISASSSLPNCKPLWEYVDVTISLMICVKYEMIWMKWADASTHISSSIVVDILIIHSFYSSLSF